LFIFQHYSQFLGGVDNDDPEEGEKKKAKRKKKSATVEKNLNNIDIAKFDLEFDVDPLFKKTSTQFDSGWFDNLIYYLDLYSVFYGKVSETKHIISEKLKIVSKGIA
jgi:hypothetical protein